MKKIIIIFFSTLMTFALAACSTEDDNGNKNEPVSIEQLYCNQTGQSFAKLTVSAIDDNIYYESDFDNSHFLIIECIVNEDFYGKLESETTIFLPISLNRNSDTYYDEKTVKEWFKENDCIIAYFKAADDRYTLKNIFTDEELNLEERFYACNLRQLDIIPIMNNYVDFNSLYSLVDMDSFGYYHYLYIRYTIYIDSGMTLEEVSDNIRILSNI